MERHLDRDLKDLSERLLRMGRLAEAAVDQALEAVLAGVHRIAEEEPEIDRQQIDIDRRVVALLALHQPVAADLRLLLAVTRIAAELERIGDQAVNLLGSAARLERTGPLPLAPDLARLGRLACQMVHESLDAFIQRQPELARRTLERDSEADHLRDAIFDAVRDQILRNPSQAPAALEALLVAKNLERVADHATNIAEDVLFWLTGQDLRHLHSAPES
jgi:phosphate transport system protein